MTCHSLRLVRTWSLALMSSILTVILVRSSIAVAAIGDSWNTDSGNWSTAANWTNTLSGHTVPATGDTVVILDSDSTNRTITYDYTGPAVFLSTLQVTNTGSGTNTLTMPLFNLTTSVEEMIGNTGNGVFNQSGGTNSITQQAGFPTLVLGGIGTSGTGTYNLSGGTLSSTGTEQMFVATFNQTGGTNTTSELDVGSATGAVGTYNLNGPSTLNVTTLYVGLSSIGTFNQLGGTDNVGTFFIGSFGGTGTYSLSGGALNASASVSIGGTGSETGVLNVSGAATLTDSGNLTVNNNSELYLSSGTLSVNNLIVNSGGVFQWTSGTLKINGSQTTTVGAGGPFGSVFTLTSGQNLTLFNSLTVNAGSLFTMNGGNLTAFSLINNGNVTVNSGGLTLSNLFNQAGSLLVVGQNALANVANGMSNAGEIELEGGGATIFNSGGFTLTNSGLVHGEGVITLNVNNQSGGEIRAEDGKQLKFNGGGTNSGKINLQGGTLQFTSTLTNAASTGQIEGRGTLIVGGTGLTNNGNMAFSAGISDVFGDVHNSTGSASQGITISGDANVTFWDDFTNGTNASDPTLFKVSSGSVATFFGTYSGTGVTGTGSVFYEADVSPGFSPANVSYGGNVTLDSTSSLKIELGGTTVGSQYDRVNVSGQLSLGGALDLVLINGFKPKAGDSFDIMNWNSLAGTFSQVDLPTLGGRIVWDSSQLYTNGALSVVATYYAGDLNRDGHIDASDIAVMEQALANMDGYETAHGLNAAQTLLVGDVNGDGLFNNADIQALLNLLLAGGGSAAPVPEPGTVVLLGLGGVVGGLVLLRRRKRN